MELAAVVITKENQMLQTQLDYLKAHIMALPYDERVEADELLKRWQDVKRLSQLQQLRVDQLIYHIEAVRLAQGQLVHKG